MGYGIWDFKGFYEIEKNLKGFQGISKDFKGFWGILRDFKIFLGFFRNFMGASWISREYKESLVILHDSKGFWWIL